MTENTKDENSKLLTELISSVQKKNDKDKVDSSIKSKQAKVIGIDTETEMAFVYFLDDVEQTQYSFYNKSGENIEEGDNVKVFYTSNPAKGWIGTRCGTVNKNNYTNYISAKITNNDNVDYDAIERPLINVLFSVDETDSDVLLQANHQCSVETEGTLSYTYKVDGIIQDFKPEQVLTRGKHLIPHIYPMTLSKGSHNFSISMSSKDGKGNSDIGSFIGALSGQISGLKIIVAPNENLVLKLNGVEAGVTLTLPIMYKGASISSIISWGDGTNPEEYIEVDNNGTKFSHTYQESGDYTITIKTNALIFSCGASSNSGETGWDNYLTAVYFPDKTTKIEWNILTGCTKLTTIALGNSLREINIGFSSKNATLTMLNLPNTTTNIGCYKDYGYYWGNTGITHAIIPQNVSEMQDDMFYRSNNIIIAEIYGSIIGNSMFSSCQLLKKVIIGKNVERVNNFAFSSCTSLTDVKFDPNCRTTYIGNNAFYGCKSLESISFPSKVVTIGNYCFYNCDSLTNVYLNDGLKNIGSNFIAYNKKINRETIILPKTLETIDSLAFSHSSIDYVYSDFPTSITSYGYGSFDSTNVQSVIIRSNAVYGHWSYSGVFSNCKSLTKIEIENGVTVISTACFNNSAVSGKITFPSTLTQIQNYAFMNCTNITEIDFSNVIGSNISIGNEAFKGCTKLKNVDLSSIYTIGNNSFSNSGLTELYIPKNIQSIGNSCFENCKNLVSAVFETEGVQTIPDYNFSGCSNLRSVDLGSVTQIECGAFSRSGIGDINFNENTTIESSAFYNCNNISSLTLLSKLALSGSITPEGGKYKIGSQAFSYCSNLTNVDGYTYKWDIYVRYGIQEKNSDGSWGEWSYTYSKVNEIKGIYNVMGATTDSVFMNTGLKNAKDYDVGISGETTDTRKTEYIAVDWVNVPSEYR